jgi:phosphatidate cytidylyltransferase
MTEIPDAITHDTPPVEASSVVVPTHDPTTGDVADAPAGDVPDAGPRAGRNLPAAIGVGIGLLALLAASLWFRPEPFVGLVAVALALGLWELKTALARHDIVLPGWPLAIGTVGMTISAYGAGPQALLIAYVLTVAAAVVWRLLDLNPSESRSLVRDGAAALVAATYLPFLAGFVIFLLGEDQGRWRVVLLILLAVASDTGGYIAGVLFGRHPLAPSVSPKKSWEGGAGSVVLASVIGIAGAHYVIGLGFDLTASLTNSAIWLGLLLGALTAVTGTIGDLAESLLKRDLGLKDMGHLLPGHGGILDRVDSILFSAPFVYLVLAATPGA